MNDAHGACITPLAFVKIPSFSCKLCGGYGDIPAAIWHASLNMSNRQCQELTQTKIPETVHTYEEYLAICSRVRLAFNSSLHLLPGSMIGAKPIDINNNSLIGGLNPSKLADNIDFIFAGFNLVISERIFKLLKELNIPVKTGLVQFCLTGWKSVSNYRVIEDVAQFVWDESERDKYGIAVCVQCESVTKKISKGTFKMKLFQKNIFGDGFVLVRGIETSGFLINQALHDKLISLGIKGAFLRKVGEW